MTHSTREGFLYGLAAYIWWGLVPLYFKWCTEVGPFSFFAHRILWSAVFVAAVVTLTRRWPATLRALRTPRLLWPLVASAVFVGFNWLLYVLCVYQEIIVQASLGYYFVPLVSVALGLIIFREALRPVQYLAIAFAVLGVAWMTWQSGEFPWMSLGLGLSFGFYGMIRKTVPVDGLIGFAVETIVLAPIAAAGLAIHYAQGAPFEGIAVMSKLSLSGVITAVPLLCFGQAARRLPISTLGFMQYISPSVQFLLAVYLYGESRPGGWTGFVLVWTALVLFSVDSYRWYRQQANIASEAI